MTRRTEPGRARRSLPRLGPPGGAALARRLLHFWILWSILLFVHEAGHALAARGQGLVVEQVTVGVGPVLWRGESDGAGLVLRALPLAGMTDVRTPRRHEGRPSGHAEGAGWGSRAVTLSGGVLATLTLVLVMAGVAAWWERGSKRRCLWGRIVVADALVLSVFNLLPVPPLDGGRALLAAVAAVRGAPITGDALFWLQVGGLVAAFVPMALWTRWTRRIDAFALQWRAPERRAGVSRPEPRA